MIIPLTPRIVLTSTYWGGSNDIETFYRKLNEAINKHPCLDLYIDLSSVAFIRPNGVIALINASRLWYRTTMARTVLVGLQQKVHAYLDRIDMFRPHEGFPLSASLLDPASSYGRSSSNRTLLEILPISGDEAQNAEDVTNAVDRAQRILNAWFPTNPAGVSKLCLVMAEIAENVFHSRDQGYMTIQRYKEDDPLGSRVEFAIADLGIGIQDSL